MRKGLENLLNASRRSSVLLFLLLTLMVTGCTTTSPPVRPSYPEEVEVKEVVTEESIEVTSPDLVSGSVCFSEDELKDVRLELDRLETQDAKLILNEELRADFELKVEELTFKVGSAERIALSYKGMVNQQEEYISYCERQLKREQVANFWKDLWLKGSYTILALLIGLAL